MLLLLGEGMVLFLKTIGLRLLHFQISLVLSILLEHHLSEKMSFVSLRVGRHILCIYDSSFMTMDLIYDKSVQNIELDWGEERVRIGDDLSFQVESDDSTVESFYELRDSNEEVNPYDDPSFFFNEPDVIDISTVPNEEISTDWDWVEKKTPEEDGKEESLLGLIVGDDFSFTQDLEIKDFEEQGWVEDLQPILPLNGST